MFIVVTVLYAFDVCLDEAHSEGGGGLFGNLSVTDGVDSMSIPDDNSSIRGSSTAATATGSSTTTSRTKRHSKALDMSIMAQVSRSQIDFDRTKKSLFNNMKNCLDKEKRIKKRENQLNTKLSDEKIKQNKAEEDKTNALKNDNYDEAARVRNVINRCQSNILQIENDLTRCRTDLIRARKDKSRWEQELLRNTEHFREKLSQFHEKHVCVHFR